MSAPTTAEHSIVQAARAHVRDTVVPSFEAWHRSDTFPREALRPGFAGSAGAVRGVNATSAFQDGKIAVVEAMI